MLLKAKIIGIGAAGNKAVISLMKKYPEITNDCILINSTLKDVPAEYRDKALEMDGSFKGCAKERYVANQMMYNTLKNGTFEYIQNPEECMTIIVTSSEGGTGSGASVMLAKIIDEVYHSPIHFYIFTGFEDDARGLKNTVDLFKELKQTYVISAISNKKFLDEAAGNRLKAEELANDKFCDDINILLGGTIVESTQNIDQSDLQKLANTPGFMVIENIPMDRIKNVGDYDKRIVDAIDNTKSLITEPSCKRFGTIMNIKDKNLSFVDYSNKVLKERYGSPFEVFTHIQDVHENEYLQVIVSGLKMPVEDIEDAYNSFMESLNGVDRSKDGFFNKSFDTDTSSFDTLSGNYVISKEQERNALDSFFKRAEGKEVKSDNGVFKEINVAVKDEF